MLYERLPVAHGCRSDDYEVYKRLPSDRHKVGKGREVNRSEGWRPVLRGKLNGLARKTRGYRESGAMLSGSLALIWIRQGWIQHINMCKQYRIVSLATGSNEASFLHWLVDSAAV